MVSSLGTHLVNKTDIRSARARVGKADPPVMRPPPIVPYLVVSETRGSALEVI